MLAQLIPTATTAAVAFVVSLTRAYLAAIWPNTVCAHILYVGPPPVVVLAVSDQLAPSLLHCTITVTSAVVNTVISTQTAWVWIRY